MKLIWSKTIYIVFDIAELLQITLICPINIRPQPISSAFRHDKKVKIEHFQPQKSLILQLA